MPALRFRLALAASAISFALACGGSPDLSSDQLDETIESGAPHALPLLSPGAARPKPGKLKYYGGPVLSRAKAVAVLWGSVDRDAAARIGPFYKAVLASPYFDWLSEYDTSIDAVGGAHGTDQHIGRGSFVGAFAISPRARKTALTDAAIEKELAAQIKKGALPGADADTLYLVHFAPGIAISLGTSRSCVDFCAYHSAFRVRGKRIAYAVMPDMSDGSGCAAGCGAGDAFSRVTSVSSHELVEATTDPEVGLSTALAPPLAWYDEAGGEIGDLCSGENGTLRAGRTLYTVQKQWSNRAGACVLGRRGSGEPLDTIESDGG